MKNWDWDGDLFFQEMTGKIEVNTLVTEFSRILIRYI